MPHVTPAMVARATEVEAAFGGGVSHLPAMEAIPREIYGSPFYILAEDLFLLGKPGDSLPQMSLREDFEPVVDKVELFIRSILSSFEPKHEHKIAGVALLLSEMFVLDQ